MNEFSKHVGKVVLSSVATEILLYVLGINLNQILVKV